MALAHSTQPRLSRRSGTAPLRVCLDARLVSGAWGGVEQFVIGLASGLSKLLDGDEEYLFLAYSGAHEWLDPYISGPCRILEVAPPSPMGRRFRSVAKSLFPFLVSIRDRVSVLPGLGPPGPRWSEGTVEAAGVDIMHFTNQKAFLTNVASIYHPWDLQHLHYPRYFSVRDRLARETSYRAFCGRAEMVAVASEWTRRDLMEHYGLPGHKVQVIPVPPVLAAYPDPSHEDVAAVKRGFRLPEEFVFYPAQTWRHKNHIALLDALALLRTRFGDVHLVSSGTLNDFYPEIARRAEELGLAGQVHFLGFVSPLELQCLYRSCRCVVFPSLFEGWGMPVSEAFLAGVPVACSNVTSLPEQAGDAALLFDPRRPEEIADAIYRLLTDEPLRRDLVERGKKRAAGLTWERTARILRAHYRRIAGHPFHESGTHLTVSA